MGNNVIQIGATEAFLTVAAFLIGVGIAWGNLKTLVTGMKEALDNDIKPGLKDIRERFSALEGRLSNVAGNSSPIRLKPKGETILEKSGLKKYIDDNSSELLKQCRSISQMNTPYDIQNAAFNFFDEIKFEKDFEDKLKTTAFEEGVSLEVVRRVGGIYFRDICLRELGHKVEDLDAPPKV